MAPASVASEPLGPNQISAGFLCSPYLQAPGLPGAGEGSGTLAGTDPFLPATLAVPKTQPRLQTSSREMLGADAWSAGAPGPLLSTQRLCQRQKAWACSGGEQDGQVQDKGAASRPPATLQQPQCPLEQDSKLRAPRPPQFWPRPQHCRARSVARLGERAAFPRASADVGSFRSLLAGRLGDPGPPDLIRT